MDKRIIQPNGMAEAAGPFSGRSLLEIIYTLRAPRRSVMFLVITTIAAFLGRSRNRHD